MHTVTEKELLSIVATLKEFRNILLGKQITVFTDHKNLTYKNFNTERVMRWRLVLEEFGPDLQYIKGERNVVADALSRLEIDDEQEIFNISECFGYDDDDLPPSSFPLRHKDIAKAQSDNLALLLKLRTNKDFSEATFRGGDEEHELMCHNGKTLCRRLCNRRPWTGVMRCSVILAQQEQRRPFASISTGKVCAQWSSPPARNVNFVKRQN